MITHIIKTREREKEMASISQEFSEFYNKLKTIKDFHRRNPNEGAMEGVLDATKLIETPEGIPLTFRL
jgi:hypothetical protein